MTAKRVTEISELEAKLQRLQREMEILRIERDNALDLSSDDKNAEDATELNNRGLEVFRFWAFLDRTERDDPQAVARRRRPLFSFGSAGKKAPPGRAERGRGAARYGAQAASA